MTHAPAPPKRTAIPPGEFHTWALAPPPESNSRTIQGAARPSRAAPTVQDWRASSSPRTRASSRRRVARSWRRRVRSAPPTGSGDAQGLDDAVSDRVGDRLFHLVQGEFESPVSAVVARECFEGETNGVGSLVGEVAQDLGQRGSGTHAGDHGVDDLGPGGAHGLGATSHAGDDPRVGQEGHADGDDEGDRPGSRRKQNGEGNDHAEAEADRDESHGIESGDAGARHIVGEALPRPPGRAFRWRGEPRGQGHDKADPEDKSTHDGDHSVPQSSREARSKPAAAKRSCRSREPVPRSQRPPS